MYGNNHLEADKFVRQAIADEPEKPELAPRPCVRRSVLFCRRRSLQLQVSWRISWTGPAKSERKQTGGGRVTSCPCCGSSDLRTLKLMRGERADENHTVLVSKMRCLNCLCEFTETCCTEWLTEITVQGGFKRLILLEPEGGSIE